MIQETITLLLEALRTTAVFTIQIKILMATAGARNAGPEPFGKLRAGGHQAIPDLLRALDR